MKRIASLLLILFISINCFTVTAYAQRNVSQEQILAQELKELGLFRGVSETNFDLSRPPSRVESVVMLIRVLGVEKEVLNKDWNHPFTDVPGWADSYVGYAYSKGLTNGESQTTFGVGNTNAAMYITFVLRALGYSDTNGKDFVWNDPFSLAKQVGILPARVNLQEFWRADVVLVSHAALDAYLKGSEKTLAQKLISAGVFTQKKYNSVYNKSEGLKEDDYSRPLTAEETYSKCSPSVFYIELYDKYDNVIGSGSGFFIDNEGTAVTNYHVIEDAYSALIQLSDTEEVHEVLGVYDYNIEHDWAVIKVNCNSGKYLTIGDASTVVGGATVYAIGSPLGLQNTISEGIISNPSRADGGTTYIQTNAAISSGSSGGALLNKYGEVIGITSAAYEHGQNLNLALPMTYVQGFKRDRVIPLASVAIEESNQNQQRPVSGNRKEAAFSLLRSFVLANYDDFDGECYSYSEEILSDEGSTDTYELAYFPEDNSMVVSIIYWYEDSHCFMYCFTIEPDSEETFAMYWFELLTDEYKGYTSSTGSASFGCSSFKEGYRYEFYDYEGDDRTNDEELAMYMHMDGLDFVNFIFGEYLNAYGYFSVADLGYTTY